jgi:hypothetical protein
MIILGAVKGERENFGIIAISGNSKNSLFEFGTISLPERIGSIRLPQRQTYGSSHKKNNGTATWILFYNLT